MNDPFETSITLACNAEHAFDAFIEKVDLWWPKSHRRFENSSFSLDARAGGKLVERADDGSEMVFGDVLSCERPKTIRMNWHPGKISQPTEVTITFDEVGDRTTVRVVHAEGKGELGTHWKQRVALFSSGWTAILNALHEFIGPAGTKGTRSIDYGANI